MQELTNDKVLAEADLNRLLGTLRYLQSLKIAREQVEAAPAEPDQANEPDSGFATAGMCYNRPTDPHTDRMTDPPMNCYESC